MKSSGLKRKPWVRNTTLPRVTTQSELEELGQRIVTEAVEGSMGFIFREKRKKDLGIDGEIEIVRQDGEHRVATGKVISVQIKCGRSYFKEHYEGGFVFRVDNAHLLYWLNHSLVVIVVLCDPTTKRAYWVPVTEGSYETTEGGAKLLVPHQNNLALSADALSRLTKRESVEGVVELLIYKWLVERHFKTIEICGPFELPRDYHEGLYLCKIGEERTINVAYSFARYGRFEYREVCETARRASSKQGRSYGEPLVCLVSENPAALLEKALLARLRRHYPTVTFVRMLFKREACFDLCEIDDNDRYISEFIRGEPCEWRYPLTELLPSARGRRGG